ncbi:MAG: curli production assembly/transport component CsgG [Elusimicrobia bacterium]|nr:MAG: curli production assembly/transport component CsgG [Elusimicrobiota bacterium]KAF0157150.1 MAG: curli production assembly/transport component CsgG [Elusimicrobiota bacterium]
MKAVRIFAALLVVAVLAGGAAAQDNYDRLAKELTEAGSSIENKKIAIIPFAHADGRSVSKDGSVISERLTIKMINMRKFEIIERSVLTKVMDELKLQNTGAIDATSAKELGKVLGVEAIITGTLVETASGRIEVNARLIKTETAQAIGAAQVTVEKDWIGDAPTQMPAQQQARPQQVYQPQQAAAPAAPRARHPNEYGFFDVFLGFGAPNMSLEFANSNGNITISNSYTTNNDIGIKVDSFGSGVDFRSVRFDKLATEGFGPLAMRVGGFGKGVFGGDIEFSFESRNIKQQTAAWSLNGLTSGNVTFNSDDYATVKSFGISGDLLIRHPGPRVNPYIGMGFGLSLNTISLPYVKGFTDTSTFGRPVNDMGVGVMLRVPIGLRIRAGNNTQIVTELRYELNSIGFDRGVAGESDRIIISGAKFLIGMGFTF